MEAQAQVSVFTLLFVVVTSVLVQCGQAQRRLSSSANERAALLGLRSSLGLRGRDWPIKNDTCQWRGVYCDGEGRVTGLTLSGLRRTRVGRIQPQFDVESLTNLTSLTRFNASGFALPGSIPDWFGERLGALRTIDLRYASLVGPIPSSLGGLTKLQFLLLAGNSLSGSVPASISKLSELLTLDLSRNSLTGSIPPDISSLGNLTTLDLSSNFFSGAIPSELSDIIGLQSLSLSDNSLSGPIPAELSELSKLVELNLSMNFLSGSFPLNFETLKNLSLVDFSDNALDGHLPEDLFPSLPELRILVLSGNKFDGNVSGEFWSSPNLKLLNVSNNNFTGNLPGPRATNPGLPSDSVFDFSNNLFFGSLHPIWFRILQSVDLSGNYLRGTIPLERNHSNTVLSRNCFQISSQRSSEDCKSFYAARRLFFDDTGFPSAENSPASTSNNNKKKLIFILAGVFGGLGFIALLASILVLFLKRLNNSNITTTAAAEVQRSVSNSGPTKKSGPGDSFTYDQIVQFTSDLSDANLIKRGRSGDIFRAFLENGTAVVVKRCSSSPPEAELEFFRKVSHARSVPFLGHCLESEGEGEGEKNFLVYKHTPNGDLASSLHRVTVTGHDGSQSHSMDWITRLKIAIEAAEFLSHLHHECNPPLVHRDIQASSILLDDKFEVRIGSLSQVRVQEGDANQNVITRLLRKPPTSDQASSAMAPAICAYDVYCFGKVLLELVTGKLGISKNDDAGTKEWLENTVRYVSIYEKDLLNKIVDPSLILDEDLLEEVWAMAIVARSCLSPKASKRPLMKQVLKALENPLKVIRVESLGSERLRTTSSRLSWTAAFFGSWGHSSSDNAFKQTTRIGSQGSGGHEYSSSSNKRLSSEIFPEPIEGQDLERQSEH